MKITKEELKSDEDGLCDYAFLAANFENMDGFKTKRNHRLIFSSNSSSRSKNSLVTSDIDGKGSENISENRMNSFKMTVKTKRMSPKQKQKVKIIPISKIKTAKTSRL